MAGPAPTRLALGGIFFFSTGLTLAFALAFATLTFFLSSAFFEHRRTNQAAPTASGGEEQRLAVWSIGAKRRANGDATTKTRAKRERKGSFWRGQQIETKTNKRKSGQNPVGAQARRTSERKKKNPAYIKETENEAAERCCDKELWRKKRKEKGR